VAVAAVVNPLARIPPVVCTLTFAWRVFADAPLVVAANRDELLDRPAEPPQVRDGDPRVLSPRDAEAGGTWIGVNEAGVFAGITNRWVDADLPGERSRGRLVQDALAHETAEDAGRAIERAVDAHDYQGFNLVVADETAALLYEFDGSLAVRNLDPGVHVVVNVGADGDYVVPARRQDAGERQARGADAVRTELVVRPGESAGEWRDRAAAVLGDHEFGVCVHWDDVLAASNAEDRAELEGRPRFGTRSSTLLTLDADGVDYRWADGPPCETPHERVPVGDFQPRRP
jgi:uncharacterized protein with NRDE domain